MDSTDIFEHRESNVRSYCRSPSAVLAGGRGSVVWDTGGREYLDFLSGAGSLNYGHNDPDMCEALLSYIGGWGIAHSLDPHTEAKVDFLGEFERLVLMPRRTPHRVRLAELVTAPAGAHDSLLAA